MLKASVFFAAMLIVQGSTALADTTDVDAMRRMNGRIQFQNYPRDSLARGEEGTVGIKVTTDKQGRLRSCAVSKSSGFPSLDAATCDLLIMHMKMKPYLAPNGGGIVRQQDGEIVWKLPDDYKGLRAVPGKQIASADPNKKICRPQTTTGSLISSQRICLTRAEWQQQYTHAQDEAQDMKPKFLPGD